MKNWLLRQRWIFGLKNSRLLEWWAVVLEEDALITPRSWIKMAVGTVHALVSGRLQGQRFRRRVRICAKCPIYDRTMRRCRVPGTDYGCGCYAPYLAQGKGPCWARALDPTSG